MTVQNDKAQSPATLIDVAEEAQVSIATASRVLNGSTRKVRSQSCVKVTEAATKLNYCPNAYAQVVTKDIVLNVVLLASSVPDPCLAPTSQDMVKVVVKYGISVTIGIAATPYEKLGTMRKLVSIKSRGIIVSKNEYTDAPGRQALQTELTQYEASGGRVMFIPSCNLPFLTVDVANDVSACAIVELIVDPGYMYLVILRGNNAHRSSKERLTGVAEMLDEASITVDPEAVTNGKFSRTDGYTVIVQVARPELLKPDEGTLRDDRDIDSIIAFNDVMIIGAMTTLRVNGIESGQGIGVAGLGDIPYFTDVFPPLTAMHLPLAEMGQTAVGSILSNRDDGEVIGDTANCLIYVRSALGVILRGSLPRR